MSDHSVRTSLAYTPRYTCTSVFRVYLVRNSQSEITNQVEFGKIRCLSAGGAFIGGLIFAAGREPRGCGENQIYHGKGWNCGGGRCGEDWLQNSFARARARLFYWQALGKGKNVTDGRRPWLRGAGFPLTAARVTATKMAVGGGWVGRWVVGGWLFEGGWGRWTCERLEAAEGLIDGEPMESSSWRKDARSTGKVTFAKRKMNRKCCSLRSSLLRRFTLQIKSNRLLRRSASFIFGEWRRRDTFNYRFCVMNILLFQTILFGSLF